MRLANLRNRIRSLLRKRGLVGAMRRLAEAAYRRLKRWHIPRHPFDVTHGVETGGHLYAGRIRSGHPNDAHSTAYFGSQPSVARAGVLRWIAELQENSRRQPEEFTFVDIGCGKGRVLLLASEFPFRRILGLELSPKMVRRARRNLQRWASVPHACDDISVVQGDVLEFALPEQPTLLYLYHPFEEELFTQWAESLQAAVPRRTAPLYLLYMNPCFADHLRSLPEAGLLVSEFVEFSPEERAAHLFGGTAEQFSLYRLTRSGL